MRAEINEGELRRESRSARGRVNFSPSSKTAFGAGADRHIIRLFCLQPLSPLRHSHPRTPRLEVAARDTRGPLAKPSLCVRRCAVGLDHDGFRSSNADLRGPLVGR